MSTLNIWLAIGALVALGLYAANAIVYRRRHGTLLRQETRAKIQSKQVTRIDLFLACAVTVAGVVGFGAPIVAPYSDFALWLKEPYSVAIYVACSFILVVVVGVLPAVLRVLLGKQ